jgi:hypothetical protein
MSKIMDDIRGLQDDPEKGASVEAMLGIPTLYRFLHVNIIMRFTEQKVIQSM